ncbi:Lactonase, 7-bladed beta-propeller-domain-containing protein [Stachybotrys elegans]|uniref:Lactonase, 7-bladed beta-propeller-domain-containing protein n=1 Tax=Stachybotrys elegans TaxID=80388 RepID=A0A8K0WMM9_9HYPO|nr:Lactonase, 7-bladed beta-propeller-domain-containing protein [Stachybotrys elegans]
MHSSISRLFTLSLTCATLVESNPRILRVAHQERGILTLGFDPSNEPGESLQLLSTTQAGYRPGWLHAIGNRLYSISRTHFPNDSFVDAGIFKFEKLPNGLSEIIDSTSSHGEGGVHLDTSRDGRTLASTNIDGSTVSLFPLGCSGDIHNASYTFQYNLTQPGPGTGHSQIQSNPHAAVFHPSEDLMFVPDRGADRMYIYDVSNTQDVTLLRNMTLLPGTGPRHLIIPDLGNEQSLLFLLGELDNTVYVYSLGFSHPDTLSRGGANETLQVALLQSISTLSRDGPRTEPINEDLAGELELSADHKFLYVSNRNAVSAEQLDTLAIYSVDLSSSTPLQFLGLNSTHGKIPRHFSLSSDDQNRYVAVANQVTNDLVVMERNAHTGFLGRVVGNFTFGPLDLTTDKGPMAVIWD